MKNMESTVGAGAKVTTDTKLLFPKIILFLPFLRVLCVPCGARVFSHFLRYE
jgi:hypothetical protein